MSINKVMLAGNLTRDPDPRAMADGTFVLGLGVAVNDRHFNKITNQWEDRPNFIDCTMFGKRAQSIFPYLAKGSKVALEGHLRWSSWETEQGDRRSKIEVIVDEIEFMSPRQEDQRGSAPQASAPVGVQSNQIATHAPVAAPMAQAAVAAPVAQAPTVQAPVQPQMSGMPAPVVGMSLYDQDVPF